MKMQKLFAVKDCLGFWAEVEISEKEMKKGVEDCIYVGTLPACKKFFDEKIQAKIPFEKCELEMQKLMGVYLDKWEMPRKCELLKQEIQKGVGDYYLFIGTRRKCNEFQKQWWLANNEKFLRGPGVVFSKRTPGGRWQVDRMVCCG